MQVKMHSMRFELGLGFEVGLGFGLIYSLNASWCFGFVLRLWLGLQLSLEALALYAGSTVGSWPLLDLNLGSACAWGLASHEANALAWS